MNSPIDFEQLAAEYARHRRVHPGVLRCLVNEVNSSQAKRVLEIGCGTGNYIVALQAATGCRAYGVDPSDAMLSTARARSSAIEWKKGRAEGLPFENATIDLIFSVDVIHHIGDRRAFFREAQRVLAPEGLACTATDSEEDISRRRPLSSHFPETIPYELARYPAIATLRAELGDAGFDVLPEVHVELDYELGDIGAYRDRAYSALHLVSPSAVTRGIRQLEADLAAGPVPALSLYTLVRGRLRSISKSVDPAR